MVLLDCKQKREMSTQRANEANKHMQTRHKLMLNQSYIVEVRGGSVVACLTQDRGVAGLSLVRSTTLCP